MSEAGLDPAADWSLPDEQRPVVGVTPGQGGAPTLVVAAGEFDDADGSFGEAVLGAARDGDGRVVVDMIGVQFINSAVIRALLRAQAESVGRGGWLRVAWTNHIIGRVIEVCGLSELFPQFATVAAATENRPVVAPRAEPAT